MDSWEDKLDVLADQARIHLGVLSDVFASHDARIKALDERITKLRAERARGVANNTAEHFDKIDTKLQALNERLCDLEAGTLSRYENMMDKFAKRFDDMERYNERFMPVLEAHVVEISGDFAKWAHDHVLQSQG